MVVMAMSTSGDSSSRRVMTSTTWWLAVLLLLAVVAQAQAVEFEMQAPAADSPMVMMTTMDSDQDEQQQHQQCATDQVVSVEAACRSASETHAGVSYVHCVASLGGRGKEEEAGQDMMHGLAVLATRQAIDHAASTESKIGDLAELEEPEARARFNHCLEQYGGAADLLRDALDNLRARIYGKAMEQLSAALGASESCEDAWKGAEEIPVAPHDRDYGRMAHIALGFTHAAAA